MTPEKGFHLALGARGEMLAWGYLLKQGYKILDKNYRCKIGEIDVVAKKGKRISFIEIKTRASHHFGAPVEAVTPLKQKKLIRLAEWYLKENKLQDASVNFGVIGITWKNSSQPEIQFIEDAFGADGALS